MQVDAHAYKDMPCSGMRCWLSLAVACAPVSPRSPTPAPHAELVSQAALVVRLTSHGYAFEPVLGPDSRDRDDPFRLVCGATGTCACLSEWQPCRDMCTLDDHLRRIRSAHPCDFAETGKLCDVSYIRLDDGYGSWRFFFDAEGTLIGSHNVASFKSHCGQRTTAWYAGVVPDCREPAHDVELICSNNRHATATLGNPMEELLAFLSR
jgi:hypothetical protein